MESLMRQLLDILTVEKEYYQALLGLSKEKKEAIVSSALESLNKIVRDEQALVARIQDREKAREKCIYAIIQISGKKDASLTALSELCPEADRLRLNSLQEALGGILRELRDQNEVNRSLIESRLNYVKYVMDSITPGSESTGAYGAQGDEQKQNRPRPNLYDQKV